MNDTMLGDWLHSVIATLEKRRAAMPQNSTGPSREIAWYIDAITAARSRILTLESDSVDRLSVRDELAVRFLASGSRVWTTSNVRAAFDMADLFLEVRKEPAKPTPFAEKPDQ